MSQPSQNGENDPFETCLTAARSSSQGHAHLRHASVARTNFPARSVKPRTVGAWGSLTTGTYRSDAVYSDSQTSTIFWRKFDERRSVHRSSVNPIHQISFRIMWHSA